MRAYTAGAPPGMISIMSTWHSLFETAPTHDFAPGEHVFRREQTVRSAFLMRSGEVALERSVADGAPLTLHVARPGALLAEASLFAEAYHCDGIARGPSRIAILPRTAFMASLDASPELVLDLLARSARELQAQRARIEILRLRRVADRLDAWLELHGPPSSGTWVTVADAIGVTPPALYRELARRRAV